MESGLAMSGRPHEAEPEGRPLEGVEARLLRLGPLPTGGGAGGGEGGGGVGRSEAAWGGGGGSSAAELM